MKHLRLHNRLTRPFAAALIALVAFAVLTSPILTAYAAAPVNAISYQGRLLDSSGNPVSDASAEFVFRFFDSLAAGSCLWESDDGAGCDAGDETQTVAINDGLFSENIGSSVDPDGLSEAYPVDLSGVFENNSDVYLEVVINGETLSPRKQIVAAPFALNSQSLDGLDSTDFLSNAGDSATGFYDFTGATISGTNALLFDGATAGDGILSTFAFDDPSVGRTITFRDLSGTVALTSDIPAGSSLWETGAFGSFEDDANVVVGTSGDETLSNAAFTLSGNDLFVADALGVEGSVYADGSFVAGTTSFENGSVTTGAAQDLSLVIPGGDLTFAQNTIIGDGGDNITLNSSGNVFIDDSNLTGTGSLAIGVAANMGLSLDAAGGAGIISIGSSADATTILIGSGIGADSITIGTATDTLGIESAEFDVSSATGAITIDDVGDAGFVTVEGSTFDIGGLSFVSGGTVSTGGAANLILSPGGGIVDIDGDTIRGNGALEIKSGGAGTLSLRAPGSGDIAIGDGPETNVISVGGNGTKYVNVGTPSGDGYVSVASGTGGTTIGAVGPVIVTSSSDSITIGGDAGDEDIDIGDLGEHSISIGSITGAGSVSMESGTGDVSLYSTDDINIEAIDDIFMTFNDDTQFVKTVGNSTVGTGVDYLDANSNLAGGFLARTTILDMLDGASAGDNFIADGIKLYADDADGDAFGLWITAQETANAAAGSYRALIRLKNMENTVGAVQDGIEIQAVDGANGGITDALDVSDSKITNAINVGSNNYLTSNMTVSETAGILTWSDLASNALMTLTDAGATGNLSVSGALSLGGDLNMANNLILNVGNAGTDFTAGGGLTLAGTLTANGVVALGDNGDTVAINSSDWDVDATGALSGIASVDSNANQSVLYLNIPVSGTDATSHAVGLQIDGNGGIRVSATGDGAGNVLDRIVDIGRSGGTDTVNVGDATSSVAIGGATANVALQDADWSISGAGAASFGAVSLTGNLDMANNLILNVGNAGTDFTGTGGLTLAGALTTNGTLDANGVATFNTDTDLLLAGTENLQLTSTTGASSVDGFAIRLENTDAVGAGTQRGLYVTNQSNATVATTESLITLDNLDSDTLTDALNISSTGTITDAIDVSAANIVNAMNVGANVLLGTTAQVDFTNFDVATNGNVTVAGGQGIDVSAAGILALGNVTATTINLGSTAVTRAVNVGTGGNADTISIGTGGGADVIGIGAATGTLTLTSGAGVINFNEFDVSGTDGSVTIDDVGGNAGKLSVEGSTLDITDLKFVGAGTVSSSGAQHLTLDSSSGLIQGGVNDQFVVRAPDSPNPGNFFDSPTIGVRGTYYNGATSTNFNTEISTNMLSAGASPTAQLDFNLDGGSTEMSLNELGTLNVIGGASFGDGTNVDQFSFTSTATAVDIMTVTANSTVAQTAGSALLVQRAHSGATNFTSAAGLLNVSMLDTDSASTGPVSKFINKGTGSSVFIDADGNTGGTVSDSAGGALHITNSDNTGYGLSVYSNQNGSSTSGALSKFYAANTGWDGYVMEIESSATSAGSANGSALHIIQNEVDDPALNSTGTQALIIDINMSDPGNGNGDNDEVAMIIRSATDSNNKIMFDYDGDVHADGSFTSTASDIAERYPSTDALTEGDLVRMDPAGTGVLLTSSPTQSSLFGAVSTRPGVLLGAEDTGYKIALTGRVPVKVSDENGPIQAGDPVTSGSVAGQGMRSSGAGMIVGFALEDYLGTGPGSISVFINPQFYVGSVLADDGSATVVSDAFALGATGTADATTMGFASNAFELRGSGWNGAAAQNVQMSMTTDVTTASDYRLSIRNTGGSEVAYVSQDGDMALAGRLYPSDRGTLQTTKYIYYDGSSGSGGDFMRTNAAGWATGSYDFAEMFPSVDALEAGDVVMFGTTNESVLKSTGSSASLAGIVSTRPGFLAGENTAGHFPIALAGRVPTKVSLENGSIAIGDPLTASATKGYAMKAVESGPIVGYALEAYSGAAGADDKVVAFVNAGYWAGGSVSPTPGTSNGASTIIVRQNADNLTALNMEGNVYMAGNDILGVRRVAGLSDRWSLEEDGTVKTTAAFKTVIESYQGELVETIAVTSPDVQITLVGTATLENGEAVIRFEDASPSFNDVTSTVAPIRVVVTPNGPVSLYVYEKNNDGFGVLQMNGSDSGITFDWMVSAYRKDYEPAEAIEGSVAEETVVPEPVLSSEASAQEAEADEEITADEPVTEPIVEDTVPVDESIPPADSTESNLSEPIPDPAG